jgi:hypothetical protein
MMKCPNPMLAHQEEELLDKQQLPLQYLLVFFDLMNRNKMLEFIFPNEKIIIESSASN